jgi:outer membrane protein assembly factor BamB
MNSIVRAVVFCLLVVACSSIVSAQEATDWPTWRGPNADGVIDSQSPPTEWSTEKNVIWKVPVPGKGHASPTVVGDKILLATADQSAQTQSVLAFDRATGERIWETQVHSGNLTPKIHPKNTHASQTVVSDGNLAFAVFCNSGKIWTTALDLAGKKVWQKEMGNYTSNKPFGFGTSPIFQDGKLFVTKECNADSFILALNPSDGEEIFRINQPKVTSYSVPVVATVAGKRQLLICGGKQVAGYDAESGVELWKAPAKWVTSCSTMVWDGDLVFASGGYPAQQTLAIRADGSAQVVWQNPVKVYEQSMIVVDGYLYAQAEKGIIYCWRCSDGKEMWKARTKGPESASPVLAGGNLYFTNELGMTFVVKPDPKEFKLVATNQLGSSSFASMTMLDDRIYTRVADGNQEWLYCLGEK